MPSTRTTRGSGHSTSSRDSKSSRHSSSASDASSQSTALTSVLTASPQLLAKGVTVVASACPPSLPPPAYPYPYAHANVREVREERPVVEDLSPATSCCPRASVDTYRSADEDEADEDERRRPGEEEEHGYDVVDSSFSTSITDVPSAQTAAAIPPLPAYRHDIVDSSVRPATPHDFAQLFPSLHRLAIRHDEFTADGNMNLRVDVTVPIGRHRRPTSYQLFHLRMYDLAKREFSLRRYCRDSGREVCNAKIKTPPATATSVSPSSAADLFGITAGQRPPALQRSMSSALRSLGGVVGKAAKPGALRHAPASASLAGGLSSSLPSSSWSRPNTADPATLDARRPATAAAAASSLSVFSLDRKSHGHHTTPNDIKLEFSNYARVDVTRKVTSQHLGCGRDSVRYVFEWWGHRYAWVRVPQKHLDGAALHLMRDDGSDDAVAHIVPETRAPTQVAADDDAGGWVPPCHMWISDASILDAITDVADVIISTGLIALVDDCIRTRWPDRPVRRRRNTDEQPGAARSFVDHVLRRHHGSSGSVHPPSPLRRAVRTY